MKKIFNSLLALLLCCMSASAQELFKAPSEDVTTRWISPENPKGEKGKGGQINKGAKGNAFYIVPPGETKTIMDVAGAGIIQRMWMSGSIARNPEQRRAVIINMYWDGSDKPAVSAPIGDFFGIGLGLMASFDSELFSNPEGRSFNFTIPMPYRDGAKIEIINEASSQVLFWYDINYLEMKQIPDDTMYFHTYWNRELKTELGKDFQILPKVSGKGRYLGTNVGVVGGDKGYLNTWFGEGEVKIYLDGDTDLASLVGTGTEDYIGTGWGQGEYYGQRFGSLVANKEHDIYAFYRYHTADAVFFKDDCKVTIQQMGNGPLKELTRKGVPMIPVWYLEMHGQEIQNAKGPLQYHVNLLDSETPVNVLSDEFPDITGNYYRSDDVSATAYFYLTTPENDLPAIQSKDIRLKDMKNRVWDNIKSMKMGM